MGNFSMEDLMAMAQKLLLALKDQSTVDLINNTVKEVVVTFSTMVNSTEERLSKLEEGAQTIDSKFGRNQGTVLLHNHFEAQREMVSSTMQQMGTRLNAVLDA